MGVSCIMNICPNCSTNISRRNTLRYIADSTLKWYEFKKKVKHNYFQCKQCDQKLRKKGDSFRLIPDYTGGLLILAISISQYPNTNYLLMGFVLVAIVLTSFLVNKKFTSYEKKN